MIPSYKYCSKCEQSKLAEEFYAGRQNWCKKCQSQYSQSLYAESKVKKTTMQQRYEQSAEEARRLKASTMQSDRVDQAIRRRKYTEEEATVLDKVHKMQVYLTEYKAGLATNPPPVDGKKEIMRQELKQQGDYWTWT